MTPTYRSILTLLLFTSLLTACGFHLRGQEGVGKSSGVKALAVSGSPATYVYDLTRVLKLNGMDVTEQAPWRLQILRLENETDQQTAAGAVEQRVALKVVYQLQTADGLALSPPTELRRERFLNKREDTANARTAEQDIVLAELQQELLTATLHRLQGLSDTYLTEAAKIAHEQQKRAKEQDRNEKP